MSNNNKRQVKKKLFSKNDIASKKISTRDKNEQEYISENFDNGTSIKTTKKLIEVEITENLEEEQRQRIAELQEKNLQLEDQLKSLNSQYESEKAGIVQDVNKYNDEIKQKSEEVNEASKENTKLMTRLKNIENNLNDKYSKFMDKKIVKKKKNIQRTVKTVKKEVDVKEEQIKNIKKKIEAEKTQRMKAENLLNEVNDGLEENHKNYIKELDEKIKVAKNEVKKLCEVRIAHDHCIKEIQSLTSQLNLVHNEIEFETKKNDMIMSTISNDIDTNNNTINTNINEEKKDMQSLKLDNELVKNKNDYGYKVRDLILKTKTPRKDKINKSAFNYIKNEFDIIKKKDVPSVKRSIIGNLNEVTRVIDTSPVQTNLFTEKETEVLKKLIPQDYIDVYNERFEMKKKEKDQIQRKFEENENLKLENQQSKYEVELLKMKLKEKERITSELEVKVRKNNIKVGKLKSEIAQYEKQLKEQIALLKKKISYNKKYISIIERGKEKV